MVLTVKVNPCSHVGVEYFATLTYPSAVMEIKEAGDTEDNGNLPIGSPSLWL